MKASVVSVLLSVVVFLGTARPAPAQVAGSVRGYAGSPVGSGLLQADDGYFYGTTIAGGIGKVGSVFRFSPATGVTTLYSFTNGGDGAYPMTALVQGADGALYGTTSQGGANGGGTVFRITSTGRLATLHAFGGAGDGSRLVTPLLLGRDGLLYGTTDKGGTNDTGTVFRIDPAGDETVLYSFPPVPHSLRASPGKLIQAADGDFYGTTIYDGAQSGTAFKITAAGVFTTLHVFNASGDYANGQYPTGLTQGDDGNFYGTTIYGGSGDGVIYRMTPDGRVTLLHSFRGKSGGADGFNPSTDLVKANDGSLYGMTSAGYLDSFNSLLPFAGYSSPGTIFRITPAGEFTTVYSFSGSGYGSNAGTALMQSRDGGFYGAAPYGGIFRLDVFAVPSAFFNNENSLAGVYYLAFSKTNLFGYYAYLSDPRYIYHFDLGYECVVDAADGKQGVYLYDFASQTFFYTSPSFPFPYLYDFTLNTVLYYYPDPNKPGRYNTDGVRYFYNFATGQIITK